MNELEQKMTKAIERLKSDLAKLRTGRANPALVDGLYVNYYGTKTPLKQVATVSVPDAKTIQIQPWEAPMCKEIEKAILEANLGFTPASDGKVVRISIPPMTQDRREEIAKQVKKMGEDVRVQIRQIRQDANTAVKSELTSKKISEDESKKKQNDIQKTTDAFNKTVDDIVEKKAKEVLTL